MRPSVTPNQQHWSIGRTSTSTQPRVRTPDQRLRVFISSTLGELADERQAARAAVEHLRLAPIMFELGARPHPPRALYRSYLEQSDVFVGIYWQRYGWIAPDMEISGLEDEYVLSAGMPRLIYVRRPAPDMERPLKEMLARLQREDTTSYKPFRDAAELEGLLVEDLALMLAERFDAAAPSRSPTPVTNLPRPVSTFLGRKEVLAELDVLLNDDKVRLVTLTGPGGTGKTRLALEAAAALDDFEDGVFFVDLSEERAPDDAYAAIRHVVPLGETGEDPPLEALRNGLRDRHVLLVLDNFEQVMAAATGLATLLEQCPRLRSMVTSREALHIRGERRFPVPPLSLPSSNGTGLSVEKGLASEAIRLFGERAAAVEPGFQITDANIGDVAAICARLDGLPLAIELAAARINLFAVDELRARIDEHVQVLGSGANDLPERQQTLRRAIEWSNELLTESERTLFRVCSVFLEARIADIESTIARIPSLSALDVMDGLGSLVDKSLLRSTSGADGRPRFSMLQTIRDYAAEQLDGEPDLAAAVRQAHAEHYRDVAAELRESGALDRKAALATIASELGNLRVAWSHWVEHDDVARLLALFEPLWGYYDARGNYRAAIELGDELLGVLANQPESPERLRDEFAVEMSLARSMFAAHGFSPEAEERIRAALERSQHMGDAPQRFPALRSLATLYMMRADLEHSAAVVPHLMAIAKQQQDPVLLSEAHLLSGVASLWTDDIPGALRDIEEAVAQSDATKRSALQLRAGPDPGVMSNVVSGLVKWLAGFPDQAEAGVARALDLARDLDHPYSTGYALFHASLLDLWRQDIGSLIARSEELLRVAETHDYPIWRALAHVLKGTASVASGDSDLGLAEVDEGFALYQDLSTPPIFWPALLTIRARVFLMAGRPSDALDTVREAERYVRGKDPLVPELALAQGDILLSDEPPDLAAARACFERAVDIARERGVKMVELEATTRLAALRRGSSDDDRVFNELRVLLESFSEGKTTPQLVAARAVLES